jgi:hypothetical protein
MALPAMRARPRRGISPSTWSRCVRMSTTAKVGRAGADEQGRDYRVRPDSAGAGSYPRSAGRRIAPLCYRLHHGRIITAGRGPDRDLRSALRASADVPQDVFIYARNQICDFEALNPFFEIVQKGLTGLVDGEHYFDTVADDAFFDFRYRFEVHGRILSSGTPYDNRFISVVTIKNRKIVHWRDYMDSLAAWTALKGAA